LAEIDGLKAFKSNFLFCESMRLFSNKQRLGACGTKSYLVTWGGGGGAVERRALG